MVTWIGMLIALLDRYNPTNLSFMEEYLGQQVANGEYDLLANLAILKLYVVQGSRDGY
jgi:translation initiation factor 3 subunit K